MSSAEIIELALEANRMREALKRIVKMSARGLDGTAVEAREALSAIKYRAQWAIAIRPEKG